MRTFEEMLEANLKGKSGQRSLNVIRFFHGLLMANLWEHESQIRVHQDMAETCKYRIAMIEKMSLHIAMGHTTVEKK